MNQELNGRILEEKGIQLIIKREDLVFPEIQGNKWRKLKYNLAFAQEEGFTQILSFGGAYSNHVAALAAAGRIHGFQTIGIIRGEEPKNLNPTLLQAQEDGMNLQFVSRQTYKEYTQQNSWQPLRLIYPNAYLIPEGGTNDLAIKGCQEIITKEEKDVFDFFACPVGTGGTIAGLILSLGNREKVIGFSALKGNFLKGEIDALLESYSDQMKFNYRLISDYHFGGYAKHKPNLIQFMEDFYSEHSIPLDPIYTGKMMYGLMDMIKNDQFERGSKIMAIHTGGLQGIAGFNDRHGTKLKVK